MNKAVDAVEAAKRVIGIEMAGLQEMRERIDAHFGAALNTVLAAKGKLIVCGMGKSGHVGRKMAATFASTGTPSFFVHPGEAFHGDLGMIGKEDVVILISYSGETDEILRIIPFLKWNGNALIGMSGNPASTLATECHFHLNVGVSLEACPLALAPTSSTTATMVMGDALAVALMEARSFQPEDFARFHPGGSLGRRLLHKVRDYMRSEDLPFLSHNAGGRELVLKLSEGRLGLVLIRDDNEKVIGIITDGDLRRALNTVESLSELHVDALCNKNPMYVSAETPILEAEELMLSRKVVSLLVEDQGRFAGVCQLYSIYSK